MAADYADDAYYLHKVAIVTGSTSGIGESIARMLSRNGIRIVINSVSSQEKGNALAHELQGLYCPADIGNEANCQRLVNTALEHYGCLDFLIHNAGK